MTSFIKLAVANKYFNLNKDNFTKGNSLQLDSSPHIQSAIVILLK